MAGQEMERSRPERPEWPDLLGWFPGWAHWPGFRGLMESAVEGVEPMRIEEHVEDNQLIVKAELPGIDPDKDVEIFIQDQTLHIEAHRRQETTEEHKGHYRREFRYGRFARRIPLPAGATEDEISASYTDGVLEVRVPLPSKQPTPPAKRIAVQHR
jgi:HSP20 family protein